MMSPAHGADDVPQPPSPTDVASPRPPTSADAASIVRIGSRQSALALVQTKLVETALQQAWPAMAYEIHAMKTAGDKNQTTALHDFGAKSLWTYELEALLLEGKIDLIVHSLKDIPTQIPPTLTIGAIFRREDPRDALVVHPLLPYRDISSLPPGSVVGTSSVRRSAQIARRYPHLRCENVRGNVGTRLAKLDAADSPYSCLVLAAAGLERLQLRHRITQHLDSRDGGLLHAVGQGALAVEIRDGDERTQGLLAKLGHRPTTLACLAERSLMRTLEGGCSVPIGVETEWAGDGPDTVLVMRAIVVSVDGKDTAQAAIQRRVETTDDADEFGRAMAKELVGHGAAKILEKITLNRDIVDA